MGSVKGSHSARISPTFTLESSLSFSFEPKGNLCLAFSFLFSSKIHNVAFLDILMRFPALSIDILLFIYFTFPLNFDSIFDISVPFCAAPPI